MVSTGDYKTDKKVDRWMYISSAMFVLVFIITIWLYFYNSSLISTSEKYMKDIATLDENIKKVNNDDKVILYTLIQTNKVFLDKYAYISKIPEFINNLHELSKSFKIRFENFSYSNSSVNTSVTSLDDGFSLSYQKTKKFISSFRDEIVDSKKVLTINNQIFSLGFIDSFVWQNEMKFNVTFKIK